MCLKASATMDVPREPSRIDLFCVLSCVVGTAVALQADVPILAPMCASLLELPAAEVGTFVGAIQASFSLGQFVSGCWAGALSDVHGRRPLLISGTTVCALGTFAFGLVQSVHAAVGLRFIMGLLVQNQAVAKAALADMSQDAPPARRAALYGMLAACFSAARALSTALTGLLASSRLIGGEKHPYLTAMAAASLPTFVAAAITACCLTESAPIAKRRAAPIAKRGLCSRVLSRLDGGGSISYTGAVGAGGKQPSHLVDDGDAHNDAHNDTHEGTQLEVDVEDARATKQGRCLGLWWVLRGLRLVARDARLRLLTSCYALNMAANGGLLVALISMLELPISEGGLGLSTQMAGGAMAWFGGAAFLFQAFLFRRVSSALGLLVTYRYCGCGSLLLGCLLLPVAPFWARTRENSLSFDVDGGGGGGGSGDGSGGGGGGGRVGGGDAVAVAADMVTSLSAADMSLLLFSLSLLSVGFMSLMPCMNTLVSNCTPADSQGVIAGTVSSAGTLLRAMGPMLVGLSFSIAVRLHALHRLFLAIGAAYALTFTLSLWVPRSAQRQPARGHKPGAVSSLRDGDAHANDDDTCALRGAEGGALNGAVNGAGSSASSVGVQSGKAALSSCDRRTPDADFSACKTVSARERAGPPSSALPQKVVVDA